MCHRTLGTLLLLAMTAAACAQKPLELEVTIKKVDAFTGQITLERNRTVREFPVAGTATIVVAGEAGSLADLRPGAEASVTYDPAKKLIVAISVSGSAMRDESAKTFTIVMVTELGDDSPSGLALSPDGLQIFFDRDGSTWRATRKNLKPETQFEQPEKLLPGRHFTCHDNVGVLLLRRHDRSPGTLHSVAIRRDRFTQPSEIRSLVPQSGRVWAPFLGRQGELLCFSRSFDSGSVGLQASKRLSDGTWASPTLLLDDKERKDGWTFPWLSADGKTLIATNERLTDEDEARLHHNLFIARRTSLDTPFSDAKPLELPGIRSGMKLLSPRYVPASKELFILVKQWSTDVRPAFARRVGVIRGVDIAK